MKSAKIVPACARLGSGPKTAEVVRKVGVHEPSTMAEFNPNFEKFARNGEQPRQPLAADR